MNITYGLWAFRDLRFHNCPLAHSSILILSHSFRCFGFLFGMVSKTGKFRPGISTRHQLLHLTIVKVNWLFRDVTTTTVYELPAT